MAAASVIAENAAATVKFGIRLPLLAALFDTRGGFIRYSSGGGIFRYSRSVAAVEFNSLAFYGNITLYSRGGYEIDIILLNPKE